MEEELIICPWCFSAIKITEEEEEVQCSVCRRIISEEDIEEAVQQEKN